MLQAAALLIYAIQDQISSIGEPGSRPRPNELDSGRVELASRRLSNPTIRNFDGQSRWIQRHSTRRSGRHRRRARKRETRPSRTPRSDQAPTVGAMLGPPPGHVEGKPVA